MSCMNFSSLKCEDFAESWKLSHEDLCWRRGKYNSFTKQYNLTNKIISNHATMRMFLERQHKEFLGIRERMHGMTWAQIRRAACCSWWCRGRGKRAVTVCVSPASIWREFARKCLCSCSKGCNHLQWFSEAHRVTQLFIVLVPVRPKTGSFQFWFLQAFHPIPTVPSDYLPPYKSSSSICAFCSGEAML